MILCDALWLEGLLRQFPNEQLSPVLNIGSGTYHFRTVKQPHIHTHVFAPLEKRGVRIIHADLRAGEGVDVVGDFFDDAVFSRLKSYEAKALICTHMFEHVEDRNALARRLMDLLPKGALFFITVPLSYHEHHDPIDTMYRPTPDELAQLFPGQEILRKDVLTGGTYWGKVRERPFTVFFNHFTRFFVPFISWRKWKRSMRKLYWLFHHYKVTAIAGRKLT